MLNLRRLQDKKIWLASAKHSEIDIKSEGKVLNLRRLQNKKIFVTSERNSVQRNLHKSPDTTVVEETKFRKVQWRRSILNRNYFLKPILQI